PRNLSVRTADEGGGWTWRPRFPLAGHSTEMPQPRGTTPGEGRRSVENPNPHTAYRAGDSGVKRCELPGVKSRGGEIRARRICRFCVRCEQWGAEERGTGNAEARTTN